MKFEELPLLSQAKEISFPVLFLHFRFHNERIPVRVGKVSALLHISCVERGFLSPQGWVELCRFG